MKGQIKSRTVAVKATGTGYGAATDISDLEDMSLQIGGTWTGTTLQVFASLDGTIYTKIGDDLTADAVVTLPARCVSVKINTSVNGSAWPSATVSGSQVALG